MLGEYFLPVPPEDEYNGGEKDNDGDGEDPNDDADVGLVLIRHPLLQQQQQCHRHDQGLLQQFNVWGDFWGGAKCYCDSAFLPEMISLTE